MLRATLPRSKSCYRVFTESSHRIARIRLRRERSGHTLAATDLVHQAYLKLLPEERVDWRSRAHFFAIASRAMRNVLVDHAVRRGAAKRGAGVAVLAIDDHDAATEQPLGRTDCLERGAHPSRTARCETGPGRRMRFFGGLSETAEALNTSAATVSRDWTFARAWLHNELASPPPGNSPEAT